MSARLFLQTLRWQRIKLLVVVLAGIAWGVIMPVVYDAFDDLFKDMANSGAIPEQMLNLGSGSLFTLPGTITIGLQHPLALAMLGIFAVGAGATAVAGERARGTLEVLLARPISRTTLYITILVALLTAVLVVLLAILGGMVGGTAAVGLLDELDLSQMPLVVLNGFGLWAAFTTFSLAMSVTFARPGHRPLAGVAADSLLLRDPRLAVDRCRLDPGILAAAPLQPRRDPDRQPGSDRPDHRVRGGGDPRDLRPARLPQARSRRPGVAHRASQRSHPSRA